jgi:ATP-dependent RNA helicase RhlE
MSTFEQFNLPKSVQKAIDDLGFTPTPIQEKLFCDNVRRDMMGIAQTGTGKHLPTFCLY